MNVVVEVGTGSNETSETFVGNELSLLVATVLTLVDFTAIDPIVVAETPILTETLVDALLVLTTLDLVVVVIDVGPIVLLVKKLTFPKPLLVPLLSACEGK